MLLKRGPVKGIERIACWLWMNSNAIFHHNIVGSWRVWCNGTIFGLLVQRLLQSLALRNGNVLLLFLDICHRYVRLKYLCQLPEYEERRGIKERSK